MPDPRDVTVYKLIFKIVFLLVDHTEKMMVETDWLENGAVFTISVGPGDFRKLIGKQARNIHSLRVLVSGMAKKFDRQYKVIAKDPPPATPREGRPARV